MNRIGVRGHDFGKMSVEELPKFIKEKGFNGIQFAPDKALKEINKLSDINEDILLKAKENFEKNEVEVSVYGCYREIGMLDKTQRLEQVQQFKQGIVNAKIIGAQVIGTETTGLSIDSDIREEAYLGLRDSVFRIIEEAEKHNVYVAIEPVSFHTLNSAELTKRLIDEVNSDKLRIILDSVNLFTVENIKNQKEIITNCFDLFGDKISALHVKDIQLIGERNKDLLKLENDIFEWRHIGEGIVDYNHILSFVKGRDIALIREGATIESYKTDIKLIKSFLK